MNSLAYVLSVSFDEKRSKENLVLNTTLSAKFNCDSDYYAERLLEIIKETKTIRTDDGYETQYILAIVIPIVIIVILLILVVRLCLQMKSQGGTVNKNQGIINDLKGEL